MGELKAELAKRRIAAINPTVAVQTWTEPLHAGDIAEVFGQFDLVVECTDDMRSRYLSNDAALVTGTPLILASVYQYEGQLQVVSTRPGAPCLRCLWPEEPAPGVAGSCAESGVLGPTPGVIGAMQAAEALKIVLDLPRQADDVLLLYNLLDHTSQRLPIDAAAGCAPAMAAASRSPGVRWPARRRRPTSRSPSRVSPSAPGRRLRPGRSA